MGGVKAGPPPAQAIETWPHRPTFLCAHPDVKTKDFEPGVSLPLGIPIDFESDLFEGKLFCRLKPIPSHPDDKGHEAYFEGKKRLYQFIVQGHFKEEIALSDIIIGDFYERPFKGIPDGILMKLYQAFMEAISPGLIMDMTSDTPKILTAFGNCQTMRVDTKGQEPDISSGNVEEDTSLLFGEEKFSSIKKRRKYLSKPKNSSKYKTNPDHMYTIEMYDHTMCFGTYYQHAMGAKIDMATTLNAQPLALGVFTTDEKIICKFPFWNERLLEEMRKMGQK